MDAASKNGNAAHFYIVAIDPLMLKCSHCGKVFTLKKARIPWGTVLIPHLDCHDVEKVFTGTERCKNPA